MTRNAQYFYFYLLYFFINFFFFFTRLVLLHNINILPTENALSAKWVATHAMILILPIALNVPQGITCSLVIAYWNVHLVISPPKESAPLVIIPVSLATDYRPLIVHHAKPLLI